MGGLAWAKHEVAARAALVLPVTGTQHTQYEPFDAIVADSARGGHRIDARAWSFALDRVTASNGLAVGFAAAMAEESAVAASAWRAVIVSGQPDQAPIAAFNLGVLLARQDRVAEAEEAYRSAIATCGCRKLVRASEQAFSRDVIGNLRDASDRR